MLKLFFMWYSNIKVLKMTENFKRGFMAKMAEEQKLNLSLPFSSVWMGGHAPATVGLQAASSAASLSDLPKETDLPELEHYKKPSWLQRNQWVFKPLVNALNIRHGSGTPVTGLQFRF